MGIQLQDRWGNCLYSTVKYRASLGNNCAMDSSLWLCFNVEGRNLKSHHFWSNSGHAVDLLGCVLGFLGWCVLFVLWRPTCSMYKPVTNGWSAYWLKNLRAIYTKPSWKLRYEGLAVQVQVIWIELDKHNEHAIPTSVLYNWVSPCEDVGLIQVVFGMGISKTKLHLKLLFRYLYWLICYISKTRALKDAWNRLVCPFGITSCT